ncbi:hypothetical protein DY000_02046374 [Brassica cretica]|uniref:F-box associated beta-propeller type 1 domain-containing protein n=1 Tax=Brassica cretica TaxID=69181 RepID=A0ABQ7ER03_BRACR|nr:hypothetical protein DY000_02046374 [Brassica cretica]
MLRRKQSGKTDVVLVSSYDDSASNPDIEAENVGRWVILFDFTTKAWRYIFPASPYLIHQRQSPVYCDGSLHWLIEGDETNVLSLDLHTETFQVIPKLPFSPACRF